MCNLRQYITTDTQHSHISADNTCSLLSHRVKDLIVKLISLSVQCVQALHQNESRHALFTDSLCLTVIMCCNELFDM